MTRQWKPGDVAWLDFDGNYVGGAVGIWTGEFWAWSNGDGPYEGVSHCHRDVSVRPLVVIDPEDRKQVQRLAKAMRDGDRNLSATSIPAVQAALREFASPTPPKPDEPMGLGAVVEDAEGNLWVHWKRMERRPWRRDYGLDVDGEGGTYAYYADITAVRILSEGVQP